jgi:hypothetical protein
MRPPRIAGDLSGSVVATTLMSRRRVTAGLLAAVSLPLVAGCDDDGVDLPGLPEIGPDPDEPLLEGALTAEQQMTRSLQRIARRHRVLRPVLGPAVEVHQAHVALLTEAAGADGPPATDTPEPAASPRAALAALVREERRLAAGHVERAMTARSGPFARLTAVLAAAATQQSVALGEAADGLRGGRS